MIIDFHTHYYPEKIVERALASVADIAGLKAATDGTELGLLRSMEKNRIDYSVALPLANIPENVHGVNKWAAANNRDPIIMLGSVHPKMQNPRETVAWIASLGFKGVKVHPEFQNFSFDDETAYPVWEACIEHDLFVLTHAGGDINFSTPYKSNPLQIKNFHLRFPELKLVAAHLGSWGMWDEVEKELIGLPIYMDLAFTLGFASDEQVKRIIQKHGAEKILWGTDSPWQDQGEALQNFYKLGLSPEEQNLILSANAINLLEL